MLKIRFAECVTTEAIGLTPLCALALLSPIRTKSSSTPFLQLISAVGEYQIDATASVKFINVFPIPSVGSHCHL